MRGLEEDFVWQVLGPNGRVAGSLERERQAQLSWEATPFNRQLKI